jgi:hypothetical protein
MVRSADDLGLFTLREDSKVMVLVIVWVDDVLLCGDPRYTKELLDHLEMQFPMRHYSNPTELHLTVTRGILRYLRGSVDCSLSYGVTDRTDQLMAFYDANYAGDRTGAKSTSAFVILLNGAAVTYSSKLQTVVAQSTTEAEVIALAECTRAVIALRGKLEAMGLRQPPETVINVDSQTAIHLAHRPSNGPRSKHYAVRLKFLREHVDRRTVRIVYIPTQHNISDLLTKLLSKVKTGIFRDIMSGNEPVVYT